MLLMIDNYDSFTFNLVQYFIELGQTVKVVRNDEISLAQIRQWQPHAIVLSPGPGRPDNAGITPDVVQAFAGRLPILGVCLGHQAIAQYLGGRIKHAQRVMHGKTCRIFHHQQGLFANLPQGLRVTRYHSLVVERGSVSQRAQVAAWTESDQEIDSEIMAIEHAALGLYGVQFHPESVMSEYGHTLLQNFCRHRLHCLEV